MENKEDRIEKYVLYTSDEKYFVEYLLKQLVLSRSVTEAMVFDDFITAQKFKEMLREKCKAECSVNTYIED